jgi:hypothetical protein
MYLSHHAEARPSLQEIKYGKTPHSHVRLVATIVIFGLQ